MKKCPYCAEEIQDEAIVCRYCGRDVRPAQVEATLKRSKPPQKSETKYTWRRAFAIVGMATTAVCVVLILIGAFMGVFMDEDTLRPIGSTPEANAQSPTVLPSEIPTATPSAITIADIEVNREKLTDVQWDDYSKSLKGVRVHWTGTVDQVKKDGTIYLDLDQKALTSVYLDGVSQDLWQTLNKGNVIEFEATIRDITTFIGLQIWLSSPTVIDVR